jgi:hypothetical protein
MLLIIFLNLRQIVGIMAALDRWINEVDSNDYFLSRMLQQKIQQRLRGQFQHQIVSADTLLFGHHSNF